jgi:hypothetical protein
MTLETPEIGPKPIDVKTLAQNVPYGRDTIMKTYEAAKYHRDETTNELAFFRHFYPLVLGQTQNGKPRPVTKEVNQIYRLRNKGKEWLMYNATFRGTDWKRNALDWNYLMCRYQIPIFRYELDPNTNEVIPEKTQIQGLDTVYDIPYSKETAQELISMSPTGTPSLIIIDPAGNKKYSCNQREFVNDDFDKIIDVKSGFAQYIEDREINRSRKR